MKMLIKILFHFFFEKKYKKNKIFKKRKEISTINFTNLEICSLLSKKLFNNDSIIIIFTIALKYWAIQRKLFKYDFVIRNNYKEILDEPILLYLIYYFLMHKGIIEPFNNFVQ